MNTIFIFAALAITVLACLATIGYALGATVGNLKRLAAPAVHDSMPEEKEPFPSFEAQYGRKPEPGRDFDPDAGMCQDDYEYFSGMGRYTNTRQRTVQGRKES